jgi:hypothetical protein
MVETTASPNSKPRSLTSERSCAVFNGRHRKEIKMTITWADARYEANMKLNRPGAAYFHKKKAEALRAALAEIDLLNAPCPACGRMEVVCVCGEPL